ncbi:MAG: dihydroorotate dehydrogenase-like protein [Candidatus Kapaibacterium sp.]
MTLKTKYMGIELRSPIIVGSSSLTNTKDSIKKIEAAGAGAVVIKSLFEEQILADSGRNLKGTDVYNWYPEAIKNINEYSENALIEHYLNLIDYSKNNLNIPVFASINCVSRNEWPQFALKFEEAGADALELNIAVSPADEISSGDDVVENIIGIIKAVRANCTIPVAVKLSPYFTNMNTAISDFDNADVDGLVLFNRLFTPEIDVDSMSVSSNMQIRPVGDINNSLRWIILLSEKVKADIAGSGGIHDYTDVLRYILAGAQAVQCTSALLMNGVEYIGELIEGVKYWMDSKGFQSIDDFRGIVCRNENNKTLFKNVQYLRFE